MTFQVSDVARTGPVSRSLYTDLTSYLYQCKPVRDNRGKVSTNSTIAAEAGMLVMLAGLRLRPGVSGSGLETREDPKATNELVFTATLKVLREIICIVF